MNGGIVKLYALTDANGAGAENQNDGLAAAGEGAGFTRPAGGRVEVGGLGVELGGAGIDHFVAVRKFRQRLRTGETANRGIRVAQRLGALIFRLVQPVCKRSFEVGKIFELCQKPAVYLRNIEKRIQSIPGLDRLKHGEEAVVVHTFQTLREGPAVKGRGVERVQRYLRSADSLHQGCLEARRDGHNLAGGLHLCAEGTGGAGKLIKGPLGEFHNHIVQRRLKAGAGPAGDVVSDLVEGIAQGYLRGNFRDGVAGGL